MWRLLPFKKMDVNYYLISVYKKMSEIIWVKMCLTLIKIILMVFKLYFFMQNII